MGKALLARMAIRWATRRSPKASLAGGSAFAAIITALMIGFGVPDEAAAVLGANLGAIATTLANLAFGDDVVAPTPSTSSRD